VGLPRPTRFGRYELLLVLGRGGMAELDLARLHGVGGFAKLVAIKRILPHLAQDRQFVEMFLNEGRIAAQLSHPNVCQVYELGEVDGELFLAMEYLDGLSWDELLAQSRVVLDAPARLRLTAGVLGQAAEGLHYAHQLRDVAGNPTPVIHRDVSPQNLFVTVDGVCKVLDFGVSKMMTDGPRTRTGLLKGKLPYMSPEQIRGEPVDARSDVFALGVVAWEALTGVRLFERDTDFLIWKAISEQPIPTVTSACHALPPAVDAVIARALDRDRDRRYANARELAAALAGVAGRAFLPGDIAELVRGACAASLHERSRAVAAATEQRVREPSAGDTIQDPAETASMAVRGESVAVTRPRRRRWPLAVAVISGVVGLIVLGVAIGRSTSDTPEREASTPAPIPPALVDAPPRDLVSVHEQLDTAFDALTALRDFRDRFHADPAEAPAVHPSRPKKTAPPPAAAEPEPGLLTVDSKPYATIFVDEHRLGDTPLFRVSVPAGAHHLRAVLADGRERTLEVEIKPGQESNTGRLSW
jgi:eukaryotic-like serine/threonine-protein kinase